MELLIEVSLSKQLTLSSWVVFSGLVMDSQLSTCLNLSMSETLYSAFKTNAWEVHDRKGRI